MPIYCFQLWMAACAAHKSLLVLWCHWGKDSSLAVRGTLPPTAGQTLEVTYPFFFCWWQQHMQRPRGAAASSDKRCLSSARWLWRIRWCRRERQRLNTRHCPPPVPGDGMKAVAVSDRDISIHWPMDTPWGSAVLSSAFLIGMQEHFWPY